MIMDDRALVHIRIHVELTLFAPRPGTALTGVVNNVSVDHIGLLVHGIFNASVGRDCIPPRSVKEKQGKESAGWVLG